MALSREQRRIAQEIIAVGRRKGANPKVIQTALATALVESNMSNPNQAESDRDSAGPFQQRPSQGWGSVKQVRNTRYAASKFYEQAIPNSKKYGGNYGALAQSVQRSAFPGKYAQRMGEARNIYLALRGAGGKSGGSSRPAKIDPNMTKKQRKAASQRAKKGRMGGIRGGDSPESIAQQAKLSSDLRYGRERAGIASLLADAQASLKTNAALEEGAARGVTAATKAAAPRIGAAFSGAHLANQVTKAEVDAALAKLGPGADPYKAATARESGGATRRLAELAAVAASELERRQVQAQEQRSFGLRRAQGQYESDRAKLSDRLQQIAQEEGTYVAATYGQGLEKAKDRKVKTGIAKENARQKTLDREARLLQTKLQQQGMNSRDAKKEANAWKLEQFKQEGRLQLEGVKQAAKAGKGKKREKPTEAAYKNRALVGQVRDAYLIGFRKGWPMAKIAADVRKSGVNPVILSAGAQLAAQGYVSRPVLNNLRKTGTPIIGAWAKKPARWKNPRAKVNPTINPFD